MGRGRARPRRGRPGRVAADVDFSRRALVVQECVGPWHDAPAGAQWINTTGWDAANNTGTNHPDPLHDTLRDARATFRLQPGAAAVTALNGSAWADDKMLPSPGTSTRRACSSPYPTRSGRPGAARRSPAAAVAPTPTATTGAGAPSTAARPGRARVRVGRVPGVRRGPPADRERRRRPRGRRAPLPASAFAGDAVYLVAPEGGWIGDTLQAM